MTADPTPTPVEAPNNDDWLGNPSPPPTSLTGMAHAAPGSTAPVPKARKAKTNLRPVEALAAQLEAPPVAADAAPQPGPKPKVGPPVDAPPIPPRGERPHGEIWDGCPVRALGVNGAFSYFLDVHGQMRAVGKLERMTVMHLFGRQLEQMCYTFAKWTKDPETGEMRRKPGQFDGDGVAMAMYKAASEQGLFDPDGAVRGVGAWTDDDGKLIYHTGDALLIDGRVEQPASHEGRIYPAYPSIPHPAPADKTSPVPDIAATLATWHWQRPEIDPTIALAMVCIQMMGGALDWRPVFWITGGKASGKSAFQTLLKHLHGPKGMIQSLDTTKSGITSQIGHSSLPVAVDEMEPGEEGSRKEADIVTLARVASSGGQWLRGSSDQKGVSGNVYSTFMFSSILIPGVLKAQDLSRLIILGLQAFAEGAPPLVLRAETWRKRGAGLKRILIDRWPTFAARLDLWREAFAEQGIGGRDADNWATIMAMAQMARDPAMPTADELTGWAAKITRHIRVDVDEIGSDADSMMLHLLGQPFDILRRGEQFTIAQWLMVAAQIPGAPNVFGSDQTPVHDEIMRDQQAKAANAKLARAGLRVSGVREAAELFIANQPIQGLKDLFQRSDWANGVWSQSAIRIKGAKKLTSGLRLAGISTRGTMIPFTSIPGLMAFPMDSERRASPTPPAPLNDMEEFV